VLFSTHEEDPLWLNIEADQVTLLKIVKERQKLVVKADSTAAATLKTTEKKRQKQVKKAGRTAAVAPDRLFSCRRSER